ncbi:MAG: hypothetical protein HUK22_06075 [Thermoguttaceae bacterium]|nr:hypothetical protein [Thermoguttaceae bacterium]
MRTEQEKTSLSLRRVAVWAVKFIAAQICAIAVFTAICLVYYNTQYRIPSKTNSTRSIYPPHSLYIDGTEGFGVVRMDENGFNNAYPRRKPAPDVLLLGASHLKACEVAPNLNTTYRLNEILRENGSDWEAYNIGCDAHLFLDCAARLTNAIDEFKPQKYAFIQFYFSKFPPEEVREAMEPPTAENAKFSAIRNFVMKRLSFVANNGFFKLLFLRAASVIKTQKRNKTAATAAPIPIDNEYRDALNSLIVKIRDEAKDRGVKLVLLFCPLVKPDKTGEIKLVDPTEKPYFDVLAEICAQNDASLVDATPAVIEMCNARHVAPNGFWNTTPFAGHLNKYGHEVIAREIYRIIADDAIQSNSSKKETP